MVLIVKAFEYWTPIECIGLARLWKRKGTLHNVGNDPARIALKDAQASGLTAIRHYGLEPIGIHAQKAKYQTKAEIVSKNTMGTSISNGLSRKCFLWALRNAITFS